MDHYLKNIYRLTDIEFITIGYYLHPDAKRVQSSRCGLQYAVVCITLRIYAIISFIKP